MLFAQQEVGNKRPHDGMDDKGGVKKFRDGEMMG
jgi:hypothetical protein